MFAKAHSSSVPGREKPNLHYKFLLTCAKTILLVCASGQLEGYVFSSFFDAFLVDNA